MVDPEVIEILSDSSVQEQIDEDTCEKHGVFCCPLCFNMTTTS